jgi:site-specific DNA recombinase
MKPTSRPALTNGRGAGAARPTDQQGPLAVPVAFPEPSRSMEEAIADPVAEPSGTSTEAVTAPNDLKRAAIYIRVSTKQQAVRDGNPEGYSLPTQRAACLARAKELSAVIDEDEYIDKDTGTAVNKRPAMQRLLERIERQRDIDYVIVHKLDRWARNTREDLVSDFVLEVAGCALVSCSESIDRSAAGRLLHSMLASVNEYHSRNMGDEIKRKSFQKVLNGGSLGPAPLGYKNVGEGGVRYVVIDPEPARLIQWAFEAYATGDWSVKSLLAEATARGLRSRGGPNSPQKVLSIAQMHRILAKPYYKGQVTYNGVQYPGKHEPLIDEDTWQRVQDTLSSKANGLKQRTHHHYLKGTIFCGHCGSPLCVTHAKGRGGTYPYYFCLGRHQKRTTCMLRHRPIELVEHQIEDHYKQVQLSAEGLELTAADVLDALLDQQATIEDERERQALRLRQLEDEQMKLLHAHYADAIPVDLLKREQVRIGQELVSTRALLEVSVTSSQRLEETAKAAVRLAANCHATYLAAAPAARRLMNNAFFKKILVTEDGVVGWEYSEPFAALMAAHGAGSYGMPEEGVELEPCEERDSGVGSSAGQRRHPGGSAGVSLCASGLKAELLAEGVGFEPTVKLPPQRFSRPSKEGSWGV